jgi:hypothetical protein
MTVTVHQEHVRTEEALGALIRCSLTPNSDGGGEHRVLGVAVRRPERCVPGHLDGAAIGRCNRPAPCSTCGACGESAVRRGGCSRESLVIAAFAMSKAMFHSARFN